MNNEETMKMLMQQPMESTPESPRVSDIFAHVNDRLDMLNAEFANLVSTLKPALRESYPSDVMPEFSEFKGESDNKNGLAQIGHRIQCLLEEVRALRLRVDV